MEAQYILFDAANTLIYKPELFKTYLRVLRKHRLKICFDDLVRHHKLISELIQFPEKTSEVFYHSFNSEILYSLGIIPNEKLLKDIFAACAYLKWDKFDDTKVLSQIKKPIGILSNFNSQLTSHINELFGVLFKDIIISENYGFTKPSIELFHQAVQIIGFNPNEILYIGDSIKIDYMPAIKYGFQTALLDRNNDFPFFNGIRISNLNELIIKSKKW